MGDLRELAKHILGHVLGSMAVSLLGLACVGLGLTHNANLEDVQNWKLVSVIFGLFLICVGIYNPVKSIIKGALSIARIYTYKPERITVLVTALAGDGNANFREHIREQLRANFGGALAVSFLPNEISPGNGSSDEDEERRAKQARIILRRTGHELLLWGRVSGARHITLGWYSKYESGPSSAFGVDEAGKLSSDFAYVVSGAIAVIVSRETVLRSRRLSDADLAELQLKRIDKLLARSLAPVARIALLWAKAGICHEFAERIASSEILLLALQSAEEALAISKSAGVDEFVELSLTKIGAVDLTVARRSGDAIRIDKTIALLRTNLEHVRLSKYPELCEITKKNLAESLGERWTLERGQSKFFCESCSIFEELLHQLPKSDRNHQILAAEIEDEMGALWAEHWQVSQDSGDLDRAASYHEAAAKVFEDKGCAIQLAAAQHNLAVVIARRGRLRGSVDELNRAVELFKRALDCPDDKPGTIQWAASKAALGKTLTDIGALTRNAVILGDAAAALLAASRVFTPKSAARRWIDAKANLSMALMRLGDIQHDPAYIRTATVHLSEAREVTQGLDLSPTQKGSLDLLCAQAKGLLGLLEGDKEHVTSALEEMELSLRSVDRSKDLSPWADAKMQIVQLYMFLENQAPLREPERTKVITALAEAAKAYREAQMPAEASQAEELRARVNAIFSRGYNRWNSWGGGAPG